MANKDVKEVYIRNLSPEDNKMLEKVRLLTSQASNTQALLKAGYLAVKQDSEIDDYRRYIAELEGKINRYEENVRELLNAQDNLRDLV
jgi:hypothetical protein